MFRHFIITRFNLKLQGISDTDKNNKPVMTEEWLKDRFDLFERYCLPSLKNQTCQNFIWFVLFDSDTSEVYRKIINKYELDYQCFKPLFLKSGDYKTIKQVFNSEAVKFLNDNTKYVITTRIDNDDLFHNDAIHEIQKEFIDKNNTFISFPYGLQYDLQNKVLAKFRFNNNHFVSRIEELSSEMQTVITHDHAFINQIGEVIHINKSKRPMWLELIHEGNILNLLDTSSVPLFLRVEKQNFQIELEISLSNTFIAMLKHIKLLFLLMRMNVLQKIGIYDFLRNLTTGRKENNTSKSL